MEDFLTDLNTEPLRRSVQLTNIQANSHSNTSTANLSATVEDWGSTQIRHHIMAQARQIAAQQIDVTHEVLDVHVVAGGWDVDAVLLVDDDNDDLLGELFTSDSWSWSDDEAEVTYYCDDETDPQKQIRERAEEKIVEEVADETVFGEDMLDLTSVRVQDQFSDRVNLEV